MNILIVRHAESQGNATGDYSSDIADSLSPTGEKQALALVSELNKRHFDKVIVSPLKRARQTAAPYLEATNQQAEIWPEIGEACWHDEREEPSTEWPSAPADLPESSTHLFHFRDEKYIVPAHYINRKQSEPHQIETFGEGLRRVYDALKLLETRTELRDKSLLMVTHGHFIREILNLMFRKGEPLDPFHHDNCGMTLVSFNDDWKMEFCNRSKG